MSPAISIKNVSKRFRLYHERQSSLKEKLINIGSRSYDDFYALDDVSFDVEEGSTFGLMGHNGSGKSTLLKLIGGILKPTSGEIITKGRIAALLELGAGMQPDLTGRENIFLNGSILGLSRKELEKRFDEIVAFSELEQFIDTQVRFYSSGMYVRLGFAVAVNVDPDILLVDEVLAVGDELFQRKCYERVKEFQQEGRTIIVVTHSVDQIRQIGDSAAVLNHGKLVYKGAPTEAIREFREYMFNDVQVEPQQTSSELTANDHLRLSLAVDPETKEKVKKIRITEAAFCNPEETTSYKITTGGSLRGQINWETTEPVENAVFNFEVYDKSGELVFTASSEELDLGVLDGKGSVEFRWGSIPLSDGTYTVNGVIMNKNTSEIYDWQEQRYIFEVVNDTKSLGYVVLPFEVSIRKD